MQLRTNTELRKAARRALDGKWGEAIVATFIVSLIVGGFPILLPNVFRLQHYDFNVSFSLWTILCIPLLYCYSVYFLEFFRGKSPKLDYLFDGYKDFTRLTFTFVLMELYIFLWSLLLIVPGIIKSMSYAMTPFVLRDHPEMKYDTAINESMRLMKGKKMKLFMLYLSFIGWFFLCLLSFGIGFFFLQPYIETSEAAFYEDLISEDTIAGEEAFKTE